MSLFTLHPIARYTFIHVIPNNWGPFVDIRACWRQLARRKHWVHVISNEEFQDVWLHTKSEESFFYIIWDLSLARKVHRDGRRCKLALVYSEALDENDERLLPEHLAIWNHFRDIAPNLDYAIGHTPWMASMLGRVGIPAFVMPAGWDEAVMGTPRWDAPKHVHLLWHGSMLGRREAIIPYIGRDLASRYQHVGFENISGCYGRALLAKLDTSTASLYIAHSDVQSFSTWRLWQVASTSAVMIAEPGDSWPFIPGKHYYQITKFTLDNMRKVQAEIANTIALAPDRVDVFNEAHELARKFTVDRVMADYIVPAAVKLRETGC